MSIVLHNQRRKTYTGTAIAPPYRSSCLKRADASDCTGRPYRCVEEMATLTVWIIQSVVFNRHGLDVYVSEEIYTITNIHTPRVGIGNRSTEKHVSISPGLEADNKI